jgi:hypothetical protein
MSWVIVRQSVDVLLSSFTIVSAGVSAGVSAVLSFGLSAGATAAAGALQAASSNNSNRMGACKNLVMKDNSPYSFYFGFERFALLEIGEGG